MERTKKKAKKKERRKNNIKMKSKEKSKSINEYEQNQYIQLKCKDEMHFVFDARNKHLLYLFSFCLWFTALDCVQCIH